jgi:hypothetical protein
MSKLFSTVLFQLNSSDYFVSFKWRRDLRWFETMLLYNKPLIWPQITSSIDKSPFVSTLLETLTVGKIVRRTLLISWKISKSSTDRLDFFSFEKFIFYVSIIVETVLSSKRLPQFVLYLNYSLKKFWNVFNKNIPWN